VVSQQEDIAMSEPRHDLYTAVHKGLRARLFDTASRIEACNFADPAMRKETLDHVHATLALLDEHAQHEDEFIVPRIKDANPVLARRLDDAHVLVHQSGKAVERLVLAIEVADADVAVGRGPELCHAFNVLVSQQLHHLNDEETLANAALWQAFSDEQLIELHGTLQAAVAPQRFAEWMALMLPALNFQECVGMLAGMRAGAPPEVFQMVMGVGREAVGERWATIERALA
jgi:hypothetical protein